MLLFLTCNPGSRSILHLPSAKQPQLSANMASTTEQKPDLGIDETPINTLERRNSLEKHLQLRPEERDLKNRHILLDTNAAP